MNYSAEELVHRIQALIPEHPEILTFDDPWALFAIKAFKCSDLEPTYFQASFALAQAKARHQCSASS